MRLSPDGGLTLPPVWLCVCVCSALLEEETRQKLALNSRLRSAEEQRGQLQDQLEEEEEAKQQLEKQLGQAQSQLTDIKKREAEEAEMVQQLEEARKRQSKVSGRRSRASDAGRRRWLEGALCNCLLCATL